ncbi:MAG: L,D-transpeptidase, partial [Pseudolabrys sp.]
IRLCHLTKRGTRVIIAHDDVRPVEISNPSVFAPKPKVASGSPESSTTGLAGDNIITTASSNAPPLPNAEAQEAAKVSAAASEAVTAQKVVPISVFVGRKLSRLFVRQGFTPLFDAPVKIQNSAEPMGTHVFNVMEFQNEGAAPRWTVVSIPEKSSFGQWTPSKLHKRPVKRTIETVLPTPDKAKAALDRIEIPQDVVERISGLLTPGSSLVISDYGISDETGKDTDFIVLTR